MISYREFFPAPELIGRVRAFWSFAPATTWRGHRKVLREAIITREDEKVDTPMVADARASLALHLGSTYRVGHGWTIGAPLGAYAIGPLPRAWGPPMIARSEMVGVYFEPGATVELLGVPTSELTGCVANLDDLWGSSTAEFVADIAQLEEPARIDRLEIVLLERLRRKAAPRSSVDVAGLARWVQSAPASMTVHRLADAAGLSRRHLARVFRQAIGVSPKRYCRLARFQAGLRYAGVGQGVSWAQVATELGYADQSHMIAEFREFSSLTPERLATQRWFHPFVLEMKARFATRGGVGAEIGHP